MIILTLLGPEFLAQKNMFDPMPAQRFQDISGGKQLLKTNAAQHNSPFSNVGAYQRLP